MTVVDELRLALRDKDREKDQLHIAYLELLHENDALRAELDKERAENFRLKSRVWWFQRAYREAMIVLWVAVRGRYSGSHRSSQRSYFLDMLAIAGRT